MEEDHDGDPSKLLSSSPYSPLQSPSSGAPPPAAASRLAALLEEIAAVPEFRNAYKKLLQGLIRRVSLLHPLADELLDRPPGLPAAALRTLNPLVGALVEVREFFGFATDSSKIFLVLEREAFLSRYQHVLSLLVDSLAVIVFDELGISDEVVEQVELVHSQLKRAKDQNNNALSEDLYKELLSIYNKPHESKLDPEILESLSNKLHLVTIADLKQESLAMHEMVVSSGGNDPGESIEKMCMLLKKIKDFVQTRNPVMGTISNPNVLLPDGKMKSHVTVPILIPDEFKCPISLELMHDPVIVSTGQTYERACIEQWLALGHDTCPSTQQRLVHRSLTTNYVLRSLIAQWCESNGLDPPKRSIPASLTSPRADLDALLLKLCSSDPEARHSAAGEIRLLAKRNAGNRLSIAQAGAVPLLKDLLFSPDQRTQEHAVTAILNLSICKENKAGIMASGCVPGIVYVLKVGTMEARENAAATLFSLSIVDEYKVAIGAMGAIPALVSLLSEGSHRGKKDAATALFNLCIYQGNNCHLPPSLLFFSFLLLQVTSAAQPSRSSSSSFPSRMPTVSVKWQKEVFTKIEIDTSQPPIVFKTQLYTLTGVAPERQKIMVKGGLLKDDADWATLGIKDGQKLMMMGTADEIVKAPEKGPVFVEDLPEDEQVVNVGHSAGLYNLGNTCYMNSTVQCLHIVPELKSALLSYTNASRPNEVDLNSHMLTMATRDLFGELDRSVKPVAPMQFLSVLRKKYPQFAQQHNGAYMQQDAEECWTQIMYTLSQSLVPTPGSSDAPAAVKTLFGIDLVSRVHCPESGEESLEKESVYSLKCHISQEVNHLHEGLKHGLKSELEKASPVLGRTALYTKEARISELPKYLTIQFVRFFWKRESNQKAKILRKVDYPLELDVYEFCSDELKQQLQGPRQMLRQAENVKFGLKPDGKNKDQKENDTNAAASEGTSSEKGEATSMNIDTPTNKPQLTGIYDLVAVLTHKGRSADSGHYVAWVKQDSGKWIEYDDDNPIPQREEEITKLSGGGDWHMAYICMYKARVL